MALSNTSHSTPSNRRLNIMEATKPKGVIYKPKRVKKLPKLSLTFEEQSMSDVPTTWRSTCDGQSKIPAAWRKTLNKNYIIFRDTLKPQKVIEHMSFSDEHKNKLKDMLTDHQRSDYFMKCVLPKGSKSLLADFKNALKLSGQEQLIQYTPGERGLKRAISNDSGVKSEPNTSTGDDDVPLMTHVNGQKYIKLMQQNDKPIINLRAYITDTDGKLHPTKKGILLTPEDWESLIKVDMSVLMDQRGIV